MPRLSAVRISGLQAGEDVNQSLFDLFSARQGDHRVAHS